MLQDCLLEPLQGLARLYSELVDQGMPGLLVGVKRVHLAVGASYTYTGGKNESAVHWDMVKELRNGGRIELDGKVVQENGVWAL